MIPHFQDHGSNERTFLAWVRTVVAIIGFGIGAGRLNASGPGWTEIAVLATGGGVILAAWLRMLLLRNRIDSESAEDDEATIADSILLIVVVALFLLLGAFTLNLIT